MVNRVNKNPATVSTVGSWWCQKKSSHIGHPMTTRRTENLRRPSGEPLLWGPAVSRLLWPPSGTWQRFKLTYFRMGWPWMTYFCNGHTSNTPNMKTFQLGLFPSPVNYCLDDQKESKQKGGWRMVWVPQTQRLTKGTQHEGCIEICIDSPSFIPLSPLGAQEGHSVFLWKSPSSKLWISGTTCWRWSISRKKKKHFSHHIC